MTPQEMLVLYYEVANIEFDISRLNHAPCTITMREILYLLRTHPTKTYTFREICCAFPWISIGALRIAMADLRRLNLRGFCCNNTDLRPQHSVAV